MSSVFGNKIRVSIFGQSHGEKIGCVVDGLPAGEEVDLEELRRFLSRRAPGQKGTTPRRETDEPHVVSGLLNGTTCGAPLCVLMDNADTHSGDYDELRDVPARATPIIRRPSNTGAFRTPGEAAIFPPG